jgi:hypothetical protein
MAFLSSPHPHHNHGSLSHKIGKDGRGKEGLPHGLGNGRRLVD